MSEYTTEQLDKIQADRDWWLQLEPILGARLIGFTEQRGATFSDGWGNVEGWMARHLLAVARKPPKRELVEVHTTPSQFICDAIPAMYPTGNIVVINGDFDDYESLEAQKMDAFWDGIRRGYERSARLGSDHPMHKHTADYMSGAIVVYTAFDEEDAKRVYDMFKDGVIYLGRWKDGVMVEEAL